MKSLPISINTLLIGLLVIAVIAVSLPKTGVQATSLVQAAGDAQSGCDSTRTVQVSGTAVVNVIPDRALIQLGVQSNGTTPQHVEAMNSATINRVTQSLQTLGIGDKDIVTDWYVIRPIYDDYDSLHIKGYRINNVVAVTLRDIRKVNQVITAALGAGANEVVNTEFYLSDLRKYRDQARELAMRAAGEKAQALAAAAGAQTGCVMSINENTWSHYNGWWYGRDTSNLWTQNAVQNVAPAGGEGEGALTEAGPIDLGQISVRAEVSASFGLK
jgi:uncharacterized protein YggE